MKQSRVASSAMIFNKNLSIALKVTRGAEHMNGIKTQWMYFVLK
jgi:hypothetical protein